MAVNVYMQNGYIKLHRKMLEWEWYDDINTKTLFLHLLLKSSHKKRKWRSITLNPGDYKTSLRELSVETGLSLRSVRTSINKLKTTHEVTLKKTNKYTVISMLNWSDYQQNDTQTSTQATHKRHTSDTPTRGTKNVKNVKNVNIYKNISDIGEKEITQLAQEYGCSVTTVEKKLEDLKDYCSSQDKKYKNYLSTLRAWVRKEIDWTPERSKQRSATLKRVESFRKEFGIV